jgi:hypothetical protein
MSYRVFIDANGRLISDPGGAAVTIEVCKPVAARTVAWACRRAADEIIANNLSLERRHRAGNGDGKGDDGE